MNINVQLIVVLDIIRSHIVLIVRIEFLYFACMILEHDGAGPLQA
jgi:hypothetical protein